MRKSLTTSARGVASTLALTLIFFQWAVSPVGGAARLFASQRGRETRPFPSKTVAAPGVAAGQTTALPLPVSFREAEGRGLLVRIWVNGVGEFTFAVDTGAGATILSPRVASAAHVEIESGGRDIQIGGLSGQSVGGGRKALPRSIAIGTRENFLPARGLTIVSPGLPPDIDGILDPTEAYSPHGYTIDFPRRELSAFDARRNPVRVSDAPPDGAVVPWLTDGGVLHRPFVMLGEGRRALLDTGSGFGLAISVEAAHALGIVSGGDGRERASTRDLAGGQIASRRLHTAATVRVGALVLRGVPTDILLDTNKSAPVILGRDALRPFRVTFDPLNQRIMFKPS